MATKIDVKNDRERRLRTRRDLNSPNINTKAENGSSKSQRTTAAISTRRNVPESKGKRTTVNPEVVKEEHKKAYSKFGAPPKKTVTSDSVFLVPQNTNGVASKTTKTRVDKKPASSVTKKTADANESTSVSVSRLKHLFDGTGPGDSNIKQRPKSDIMHVTIEPANPPVSGRWSLPDYSRKGVVSPTSHGHNFKIHVSQGIAAKRAKFESGGSTENLTPRRDSLRLSDLVPGLDEAELTDKEADFRSRTKSDPVKPKALSGTNRRRRFPSDTGALDDSSVQKPQRDLGKLYKSKSADHLFSGELSSPAEDILQTKDVCLPRKSHREKEDKDFRAKQNHVDETKEERVTQAQSCVTETAPRLPAIDTDDIANEKKAERPTRDSNVYVRRQNRKDVNKQVPVDNDEPTIVRQASWKDDPEPPEEPEQLSLPYSSHTIDLPSFRPKDKEQGTAESKESSTSEISDRDSREHRKGTPESSETREDESEMSDNESTGSVIEHSSPEEEVSSPVSLLFHAKPSAPSLSKNSGNKKGRKVGFTNSPAQVGHTYSAEEYDRGNDFIDPVTASAEWELEKRVEKMDIFSVDLEKDEKGLGLSIIGLGVGTDTGVEKLGIFVKSLTEDGAAEKDARIQVNDQIIEVNGVSLVGVTQQFAGQTLKHTSGTVKFLMGRDKSKAHFTNLPEMSNLQAEKSIQGLQKRLKEIEEEKQKAEQRAEVAEMKLENLKNQGPPETKAHSSNSDIKKLEKALAEMTERAQKAESGLAFAEGENDDMVKQLEGSKGLYLILEKKLHKANITIEEYEAKRKVEVETMKRSNEAIETLQNRIKELERQLKEARDRSSELATEQEDLISSESVPNQQEAAPGSFLGLDIDMITGKAEGSNEVDLNTVPPTTTLSNEYLLEKRRLAEAQQKKYKPTRASWGKSLDDENDMFAAAEDEDEEEEELNLSTRDEPSTMPSSGPAFMLPSIPLGGFKLRPTAREVSDDSVVKKEAPTHETRASYPLSNVERTHGIVVENLLEKQLAKADSRVSSLPGNTPDQVDHSVSPVENPDECLSASTNSLEEIGQAARRIDSDLASSMASSTGSSPFLPPAMPLLEMKGSYKEVAVDCPPDLLLSAAQSDSEGGSVVGSPGYEFSPQSQGERQSLGNQSPRLSRWTKKPAHEWDTNQVGMWLVGLEMPEYLSVFANKNIDGKLLLNLDTSKMKAMGVSQTHRALIKKKIKEMKVEMEREKKQREKEQKAAKKEARPKDKLEKIGFMKKGKSYTVNTPQ